MSETILYKIKILCYERKLTSVPVLDAVRMMEERLNGGLQNINKNLESMNRRIDRLEDQQDEIADSMESQRTLVS